MKPLTNERWREIMASGDYLTIAEACRRAHVHRNTMRGWCKRYELGRKVGGEYRVDPERLQKLLDGKVVVEQRASENRLAQKRLQLERLQAEIEELVKWVGEADDSD